MPGRPTEGEIGGLVSSADAECSRSGLKESLRRPPTREVGPQAVALGTLAQSQTGDFAHGSGAGVGSGAGEGRTSSPEQKLKWRHDETNDEVMWRFASGDDSVFPLGLSAPHDGYPVGNPRDGHHEGLSMTSNDDGIPMPMTMLFPGRTAYG